MFSALLTLLPAIESTEQAHELSHDNDGARSFDTTHLEKDA